MMICLGIDPGKAGGIAKINLTKGTIEALKMPETLDEIVAVLSSIGSNSFTIIEEEHARPSVRRGINPVTNQEEIYQSRGAVATWTFAQHYGELLGILSALHMPHELMKPKFWMKSLGLRSREKGETQTHWKNFLKERAQQMYPGLRVTLATADALLIAEVCHRLHGRKTTKDFDWEDF